MTIQSLIEKLELEDSDLDVLMRAESRLSERKTVHCWLNDQGVPKEEYGKPLCLLRRLAIALDI